MKKFIFKLLPFLLLIVAFGVVRYYFKYDARYNYYNVSTKAISKAVVVVGDSKTLFGIDAHQIKASPFYNLSSWGARPFNTLEALESFDLQNNVILLSVSSRIFLQNDTVSSGQYNSVKSVFDYNLYTEAHTQMAHAALGSWEYEQFENGCLVFKDRVRQYAPYIATKDTTFYGQFMHAADRDYYVDIKLKHFLRLYKKLSETNKVVLIDLPERASFNKMVEPFEQELFEKVKQLTGETVIDFGTYGDEYFYDSHHMNALGAKKFTESLQRDILTIKKP